MNISFSLPPYILSNLHLWLADFNVHRISCSTVNYRHLVRGLHSEVAELLQDIILNSAPNTYKDLKEAFQNGFRYSLLSPLKDCMRSLLQWTATPISLSFLWQLFINKKPPTIRPYLLIPKLTSWPGCHYRRSPSGNVARRRYASPG